MTHPPLIPRWRRWWWLLLAVPLVAGLARLRFSVEVLDLLPAELPVVQGLKLQQRHFANARELLITVRATDADAARSAAQQLAIALRQATNLVAHVVWQSPWMEDPGQVAELLALNWLNQPPALFAQMASRLAPENLAATLDAARVTLATTLSPADLARLGYDPLGLTQLPGASSVSGAGRGEEMFASPDGAFRILYVQPADELKSYRECGAWLERIRGEVARAVASPDRLAAIEVGYTGGPAFLSEIATGMERDMRGSVLGTLAIIAGLFLWAHRRLTPLLWLLLLLGLILAGTLALGGLVFGTLNVVSFGFAAILLGLAVDYGLVLYQEALGAPQLTPAAVRCEMAPGIVWSAVTTAGAFALLNFGGLPGLAQLGTLVALGIGLAAAVMLFAFLPLATRGAQPLTANAVPATAAPRSSAGRWPLILTLALVLGAGALVWFRSPPLDHTADALRPVNSPAYTAMDAVKAALSRGEEPLWLLLAGTNESAVARQLAAAEPALAQAVTNGRIAGFTLPTALWPQPERQAANRVAAVALAAREAELRQAVQTAGFTDDAFLLTRNLLAAWASAAGESVVAWPTNAANRWLVEKIAARRDGGWLALGLVQPAPNSAASASAESFGLPSGEAWLTGWPLLGEGLLRHVETRLPWLLGAMLVLLTGCLWLAFGRVGEVLLGFAALGLSLLSLLAVMSLAGWSWNLLNLMALPLLLGSGVDYTIHIQLALRRHGGDVAAVRRATGRALLLCAGSTVAGFGSLAWSGNAGLASLGRVCATGVGCVFLVAVFLLPAWWQWLAATGLRPGAADELSQPSTSYRVEVWRLGLFAVRVAPRRVCQGFSLLAAAVYRWLRPQRVALLTENLLPVFAGDRAAARRAARTLVSQFALKITDLLRHESGADSSATLAQWSGWERFEAAQAHGRGVLLITPHLGNWEFGGYLLARRGVRLLVLTQAEPGAGFTELRQRSRARWGIETLVVGQDAFAFVEVIKRLGEGASVALLMDRPPPPTAVEVELFGRPFRASVAAAELARASGCAVLPVYVVREGGGYGAHVLPELAYDRRALCNRDTRRAFTQEIARAFEPVIRQYPEQWYHFVPIWQPPGPVPATPPQP